MLTFANMNKAKELIKELKQLMGLTDPTSEARRDEIAGWFKENNTPENVELFQNFMADGLNEARAEIVSLQRG